MARRQKIKSAKMSKQLYQTDKNMYTLKAILQLWCAYKPPEELTYNRRPLDHTWAILCTKGLISESTGGQHRQWTSTCAHSPLAKCLKWNPLPWRCVVHIQQRLVEIGQIKVVLCFVIFCKSFILGGRKFTQWGKVSVHISYIKPMRLIKISIPTKKKNQWLCSSHQLFSNTTIFNMEMQIWL